MGSVHLVSHHLSHLSSCLKSMVGEVKPVASSPSSPKGEGVVTVAMDNHLVIGGAFETVGKSPEDHCFPECPSLEHPTHALQNCETTNPVPAHWVRFLLLVSKDILTNALGPVQPMMESQGRIFYLLMVVTGRRNLTFMLIFFYSRYLQLIFISFLFKVY